MRISIALAVLAAASSALAQTRTVEPPAALTVENVPAVSIDLQRAVDAYTEFRGASPMSWSPNAREIIIRTRFGDVSQAHLVRGPGMARQQLTFDSEGINFARFPRNSDRYLLVSADTGGSEFNQIYRLDLDSLKWTLLTDGKSRNGLSAAHRDGRIAFSTTRRNGRDIDIVVFDPLAEKELSCIELEGNGWGVADWDRGPMILQKYISVTHSELYTVEIDGKTPPKKIAPQDDAIVAYGGGKWIEATGRILTTSNRSGEFERLVLLDPTTGEEEILTPKIEWDIDSYSVTDDQKLVAFIANEAGRSVLRVMSLEDRSMFNLPELPAGQIGSISWRPGGRELAFSLNSAKSPGEVWSINLDDSSVHRWTFAEGAIPTDSFAEAELIEWTSFDGLKISGWLYRPDAKKFPGKRPVLVSIHGGPEGQSRPGFIGRFNYFLNELGVAVIFPNVRGSTGFGKTFVSLDNGFKREDSVKDIGSLLDWIAAEPTLDETRVMTTGGSYGGYMAYACAVHYSDRLVGSMSSVGISNFVTFLNNTQDYRRDLRRVEYGDERDPAMYEHLQKISPLNNAEKIRIPMMIVQGRNDPRVPVTEALQMVKRLRDGGNEVWYIEAADEGHGFAKKPNADYQFYAMIQFIQTHLLKE